MEKSKERLLLDGILSDSDLMMTIFSQSNWLKNHIERSSLWYLPGRYEDYGGDILKKISSMVWERRFYFYKEEPCIGANIFHYMMQNGWLLEFSGCDRNSMISVIQRHADDIGSKFLKLSFWPKLDKLSECVKEIQEQC